ncbi:Spx/MgsR family RNA polymerase-binding regulatory protein [Rehaibacterium terrae]|uniref:Spx/MgsR family transcriptional regulator n=1 Tax=Rehaibacterium terrae TaxID=1341696 RepID=A0A7W8DDD5_9GAMM|nr:Spx/MgsR family RNA polymerase-binding regulatory protein [Rehaibacterium terrae]MBB5014854.1 Spx/MgsR family transcriptional regulator [Rehaibacterium terrae]
MADVTVYGLDKCDTCRKARNWLDRFGIAYRFVDYREQRVAPDTLKAWARQLGGWDKLINRASTTWRALPEARKSPGSDPEWTLLLKEYPALVKRPVLVTADGTVSVGFTDKAWKLRFGLQADHAGR